MMSNRALLGLLSCAATLVLAACCRCRITEPREEATVPVSDVLVKWSCDKAMVIQYYQDGECKSGRDCTSRSVPQPNGSRINIPTSGRTEIKIWGGSAKPADSIWINVVAND